MEPHTRIPNWMLDWVLPRLRPAERACLLYIARRTIGFAEKGGSGQRKRWDRISISQFTDGVKSGSEPLDLGSGSSRRAVIDALGRLEELGLVLIHYQCPVEQRSQTEQVGCGWSGAEAAKDKRTAARACPRCSRTLSRLFCLKEPTGRQMTDFLSATDPQGRRWYACPRTGLYSTTPPPEPLPSQSLPAELWEPALVDELIGQAAKASRQGKMGEGRKVDGFYRPAIALQQQLADPEAVRYALQKTVKAQVCCRPDTRAWPAYARKCGQGYLQDKRASAQGSRFDKAEEVLEQCGQLNREGRHDEATARLGELIADRQTIDRLAARTDLRSQDAARRIIAAYRRGISDWLYVDEYTVPERYRLDLPS